MNQPRVCAFCASLWHFFKQQPFRGTGDCLFGTAQAFTWIAEELGRQYSLGYYPAAAGKNGERRNIKVKGTEPDLVVKARDSYIYTAATKLICVIRGSSSGKKTYPASPSYPD
jgi:hypothetical protein